MVYSSLHTVCNMMHISAQQYDGTHPGWKQREQNWPCSLGGRDGILLSQTSRQASLLGLKETKDMRLTGNKAMSALLGMPPRHIKHAQNQKLIWKYLKIINTIFHSQCFASIQLCMMNNVLMWILFFNAMLFSLFEKQMCLCLFPCVWLVFFLTVHPSVEPGWLQATYNGKTGLIPENYVTFL